METCKVKPGDSLRWIEWLGPLIHLVSMSLKQKSEPETEEKEVHSVKSDGSDLNSKLVGAAVGAIVGFIIGGPIGSPIVAAIGWILAGTNPN